MRCLWALPILLLLAAPGRLHAAPEDVESALQALVARTAAPTVSILARGGGGSRGGGRFALARPLSAVGSGVLIQRRGLWILTSLHVVDEEPALEAVAADGVPRRIYVRGRDEASDLALVGFRDAPPALPGLDPARLRPVRPEIGSWVLATGNPFFLGLDGIPAASFGILSGVRPAGSTTYIRGATFQHDAEINPGSSGGPLWDMRGALIGINGTIATRARDQGTGPAHTGASFSVPIGSIVRFLDRHLGAPAASGAAAPSSAAMAGLEARFTHVARRARDAAVLVRPRDVPRGYESGQSSGVVILPSGLVLSDGDAGLRWRNGTKSRQREVRVRVRTRDGRLVSVPGTVVHRNEDVDTSLIRLAALPQGGLSWIPLGQSAPLRPGAFLLAAGTTFEERIQTQAAVTAGILASSEPGGFLYTTAAVNKGVNGGPVVGLDGRLVGTVSTWVDVAPDTPHQMLGRVVPIDRIRRTLPGLPGIAAGPVPTGVALDLQGRMQHAAARAARGVVSLEIQRSTPVATHAPMPNGTVRVSERWRGPVSGLVVDPQGWIVTSLYNLTDVATLVQPMWKAPAAASVQAGLDAVTGIRVRFPGGESRTARIVAHDGRLGIVLLRCETSPVAPIPAAPPGRARAGSIVVTAGFPGRTIVTAGILSKLHPKDVAAAWRGSWQTDAAGLDTNCGGAAVDLDGRLLGMLQLWHPARHGRGSGVAFVVPWTDIQAALPGLKKGRMPRPAFLGIRFARRGSTLVGGVVPGSGAEAARFRAGDVIHQIDRERITGRTDLVGAIAYRRAGEVVTVRFERAGRMQSVQAVLGVQAP